MALKQLRGECFYHQHLRPGQVLDVYDSFAWSALSSVPGMSCQLEYDLLT